MEMRSRVMGLLVLAIGSDPLGQLQIGALSERFGVQATLAGEETVDGAPCHVLELKARNRGVAYDRVRYLVRKDGTFFPCLAEYFTISGKKLKVLRSDEVETLGGRKRPTRLVMESALETGASTELKFLKIDDRPKLDERMFSPASLERER